MRWLAGVTYKEASRTETHHDNLRAAVFLALNEMRKIMSRATMFIPADGLRRLEYYNFMYHNSLNGLAQEAINAGKKLWKLRPKGHQNHVRKCMFFFLGVFSDRKCMCFFFLGFFFGCSVFFFVLPLGPQRSCIQGLTTSVLTWLRKSTRCT